MQKISIDNIDTASLSTVFVTNAAGPVLNKITTVYVTDSSYNNTSVTAVDVTGGYIKIVGTGFVSGCQVLINTVPAAATTFISSTEVRAQVNATTAGTYIVYLVNPDGGTAIRVNGITFSTVPTWATSSTLTTGAINIAISIQLSASSDSATTFSVASGSTLPAGLALSSSGLLSGTVTGLLVATLYSFTVVATDSELQTNPRTFNITISAGDPYFAYTTLLLSGATATSTFIADASTNNFVVTVTGDTKPNNFNPYTPGYYSNYFNGSSNFTSSTSQIVPTGSFTVECWVYVTSTANQAFVAQGTSANAARFSIAIDGGLWWTQIGNASINTGTPIINTWNYLAVTFNGSTLTLYVNGASIGTLATSTSAQNTTLTIGTYGSSWAAGYSVTGYISNVRVSSVVRTIITPTAPYTSDASTRLLTCQSNRFLDNSANAFALTITGTPSVQSSTPFVPNTTYATYGSTYFDGTGDYLTVPSNAALAPSTGDFTCEAWISISVLPSSGGVAAICQNDAILQVANNTKFWFGVYNNSGTSQLYLGRHDTANRAFVNWTPTVGVWYHVAAVRQSGTVKLFIDGVLQTVTGSTDLSGVSFSQGGFTVGAISTPVYMNGYISNFRYVVGTAVYTSSFTPSITPLTAISGTQLLTLQTNQPVNNSVFLDNSTNAFAITRVGNTTQGTFSPYGVNWSNYFDGSGDKLTLPSSSAFDLSGSTWTIEFWMYSLATPPGGNDCRLLIAGDNGGAASWDIQYNNNASIGFFRPYAGSPTAIYSSAGTIALNTWYHIAVVCNAGSARIYINGVSVAGPVTISLPTSAAQGLRIGYDDPGTVNFQYNGYLSNVRIVKGVAVYTANFTPSTTPLTATQSSGTNISAITGTATSLLTCQSNRLIDNSTNAFAVTKNGDVAVQRFSPFSPSAAYTASTIGGSAYFDGSGDYLTTPSSSLFNLNGINWTVEGWFNLVSATSDDRLFVFAGASVSWGFYRRAATGNIYFGQMGTDEVLLGNMLLNEWTHLALVRTSGPTISLYKNGVFSASTAAYSMPNENCTFLIAGNPAPYANTVTKGYVSDVRAVKGTAVYTSNFVPPAAPLTAITNTSLLLNMTSAGVYDSTMINDLETVGDAKRVATQTPYAGSYYSNLFDGTGDYLSAAASSNFDFGSENFTIETWFYASNDAILFSNDDDINNGGVVSGSIALYFSGAGIFFYRRQTSGAWAEEFSYSAAIAQNTWHHVAVVKSGTNIKIFFNGSSVLSTTAVNTTFGTSAKPFSIGSRFVTNYRNYLNGYISNLRVVKGVAVYTGTFTPPTAPLSATQAAGTNISAITGTATSLLTCQSNSFLDNSTNLFTITRAGDTSVQSFNPFQRNSAATMYFDGTGDYLYSIANQTNNFGTGNFTVECWVYFSSVGNGQLVAAGTGTNTNAYYWQYYSSQLQFGIQNVGSITVTSWTPIANAWYHIAVVRSGTNVYQFVNGTQLGSTVTSSQNFVDGPTYVGYGGAGYLNGYINDLRITKGYARYTSTFTPPTTALKVQ